MKDRSCRVMFGDGIESYENWTKKCLSTNDTWMCRDGKTTTCREQRVNRARSPGREELTCRGPSGQRTGGRAARVGVQKAGSGSCLTVITFLCEVDGEVICQERGPGEPTRE